MPRKYPLPKSTLTSVQLLLDENKEVFFQFKNLLVKSKSDETDHDTMTIEDYLQTLRSVQLALIQIKNEREECHQLAKVRTNDDTNSFVNIDESSIHEANNIMSTMDSMDQNSTILSLPTLESISSPISRGNSSEKCGAIYMSVSNCSGVKIGFSKISIDSTSSRYLTYICSGFIKYYKIDENSFRNNGSEYALEQKLLNRLSTHRMDDSVIIDQEMQRIIDLLGMQSVTRTRKSFKSEWFNLKNNGQLMLEFYDSEIKSVLSEGLNNSLTKQQILDFRKKLKVSLTSSEDIIIEIQDSSVYNCSRHYGANVGDEEGGQQPLCSKTVVKLFFLILKTTNSLHRQEYNKLRNQCNFNNVDPYVKPVILWVGCGYGEESIMICNYFRKLDKEIIIYGIDLSELTVMAARRNCEKFGVDKMFSVTKECLFSMDIESFMEGKEKINVIYTSAAVNNLFGLKLLHIASLYNCNLIIDSYISYSALFLGERLVWVCIST